MNKKYWRISYKKEGIYAALKKRLWDTNKIGIWNELKNSDKFNWLKVPNGYSLKCRSYFTEIGYMTFVNKTLPIMKEYLNEDDIIIEVFEFDYSNLKIVYEDEHQIVIEI